MSHLTVFQHLNMNSVKFYVKCNQPSHVKRLSINLTLEQCWTRRKAQASNAVLLRLSLSEKKLKRNN